MSSQTMSNSWSGCGRDRACWHSISQVCPDQLRRQVRVTSAADAIEARRAEDLEAMSVLQAKARHLDFVDSQYGGKLKTAALVKQLSELISEIDPEFVLAPLGLIHPDHVAVREAVLEILTNLETPVWLFEDLPARVQYPEAVAQALNELRDRGYETELGFIGTGPAATKMDALWA